jgi:transposase
MDLTDAQWAVLEPLFRPRRRSDGRGRPWRDTRAVLNGVLWILRTGAPWHDLPSRYPPYQTCHRRFQHWQFWTAIAIAPKTRRGLARSRQARFERSVCRCQLQLGEKRGSAIGPTRRGKGSKIMAISDGHGLPLAVYVASASPHETKLVEATLDERFFADLPERLIGDRAYDSDPLDERLMQHYGIEMIAPHHSMRTRTLTQDGRVLRRYRRRWKVERLFAWLHNYRRIVVRWERYPENFLAMLHLASAIILLRHL